MGKFIMWPVDTTKHFKIWFSKDKNIFLGIENQLRLVKTRAQNPQAIISLVYSSKCLNSKAKKDLASFCEKHRINPIDFDTQVESLLTDEKDIAIYQIALLEIKNTLNNQGGNLGAAADCARLICPLLAKAGIYTDFDVDFNTSLKEKTIKAEFPIIFNSSGAKEQMRYNSDVMITAHNPSNPKQLHEDAIRKIGYMQEGIIKKYRTTNELAKGIFITNVNGLKIMEPLELQDERKNRYLEYYFDRHPKSTVFDLRKHVQNMKFSDLMKSRPLFERVVIYDDYTLSNSTDNQIEEKFKAVYAEENVLLAETDDPQSEMQEPMTGDVIDSSLRTIKHSLYLATVCRVSGPINLMHLFRDNITIEKFDRMSEIREGESQLQTALEKSSLACNGFANCFKTKNDGRHLKDQELSWANLFEKIGSFGDQSWTSPGQQNQSKREEGMVKAATTLQKAFRKKYLAKNQMLQTKSKGTQSGNQPEVEKVLDKSRRSMLIGYQSLPKPNTTSMANAFRVMASLRRGLPIKCK